MSNLTAAERSDYNESRYHNRAIGWTEYVSENMDIYRQAVAEGDANTATDLRHWADDMDALMGYRPMHGPMVARLLGKVTLAKGVSLVKAYAPTFVSLVKPAAPRKITRFKMVGPSTLNARSDMMQDLVTSGDFADLARYYRAASRGKMEIRSYTL